MVGLSQQTSLDQWKVTLFHSRILMASLQFLLYQELLTSRRPHLIEFSVELGWLSLLGVACICSLENKYEFLLNKCWGQADPKAVGLFSLFGQHILACLYLRDSWAGIKYQSNVPTNSRAQSSCFLGGPVRALLVLRNTIPLPLQEWDFPCRSGTFLLPVSLH